MGYNSVAFILNESMNDLKRAPNALAYGLSCPPMSDEEGSMEGRL